MYPIGGPQWVISLPMAVVVPGADPPTATYGMSTDPSARTIRILEAARHVAARPERCKSQGAVLRNRDGLQMKFIARQAQRAATDKYYREWQAISRTAYCHTVAMRPDPRVEA